MKPANPQAKRLHVRLVTLMLGLITAFFLSLSLVTWYMGTERDLRDTNDKITRVGRELKGVLDAELVPMKTAIRMLAETSLVSGQTHRERLALLGSMAATLAQNPTAGSVYAGTGNGSFVLMRNLKDRPKDRATFSAPEQAVFLVQSVNRDGGSALAGSNSSTRSWFPCRASRSRTTSSIPASAPGTSRPKPKAPRTASCRRRPMCSPRT
jgi:hypothetical protein